MNFYNQGQQDALIKLGISVGPAKPLLGRIGGWLRKKMPTARGVRQGLIGSPRRFRDELVSGQALGKGSLLRQSFHAPTMMSKAMFYGLPAVEVGSIAMGDEGNKARRIGGAIGGAGLGLAAWKPLGLVGSMGAGMLGASLGSGIGGAVGRKLPENTEVTPPTNNTWGYQ